MFGLKKMQFVVTTSLFIQAICCIPHEMQGQLTNEDEDGLDWAPVWVKFVVIMILVCLGGLVAGMGATCFISFSHYYYRFDNRPNGFG